MRRARTLLLSADEGLTVAEIANMLECNRKTVLNTIHAFHNEGLAFLYRKSRARRDDQRAFDDWSRKRLWEIIQRPPGDFDHSAHQWTLDLLAQTSFELGLVSTRVTLETVRATLAEMGINWRQAKKYTGYQTDLQEPTGLADEFGQRTR
jgi:transposase